MDAGSETGGTSSPGNNKLFPLALRASNIHLDTPLYSLLLLLILACGQEEDQEEAAGAGGREGHPPVGARTNGREVGGGWSKHAASRSAVPL